MDHLFVSEFMGNNDVEFRSLSEDMSEKVGYHFMVMDRDSYRFEKDKNEPSAIAAFGDTSGGERLTKVFDTLWDASEELEFSS